MNEFFTFTNLSKGLLRFWDLQAMLPQNSYLQIPKGANGKDVQDVVRRKSVQVDIRKCHYQRHDAENHPCFLTILSDNGYGF